MSDELPNTDDPRARPGSSLRESSWPAGLGRVIESQIVPRLLLHAIHSRIEGSGRGEHWHLTPEDVDEFARLLLVHDTAMALAYVDMRMQQGVSAYAIFLDLLAPTVAHLRRLRLEGRAGLAQLLRARYRLLRVLQALRRRNIRMPASATVQ